MCEYSECLIAWMDGELIESEAAEVEQHVRACAACRDCASTYEAASREFASYYAASTQAAVTSAPRRSVPFWIPAAAVVAAIAAMLAIAFMPHATKQARTARPVAAIPAPVASTPLRETAAPVIRAVAKRHVAAHKKPAATEWAMIDPPIQIAIPADAMFPPGAVPEGVTYIANVSFGTDGMVQGIQLATSNK